MLPRAGSAARGAAINAAIATATTVDARFIGASV
jgi:hypothetical protein